MTVRPCRVLESWRRGSSDCTDVVFGNYDTLKSHASGQKLPEHSSIFSLVQEQTPFSKLGSFPITVVCGVESFSFEVNCGTTGLEVKCMVEERTGIPPARQRVHSPIAGRRMLDDSSTLEEVGTTSDCNLDVCIKLHGGGDNERSRRASEDFSKHSSPNFSQCGASRRVEEGKMDDGEQDDLQGLIRFAIRGTSVQACLRILEDKGFESVKSLRGATVDGLIAIGLKEGYAHSIVREVPNWIPRRVRLRCCTDEAPQSIRVLTVKMNSSLQHLRCTIAQHFQEDFVFICEDAEIEDDQESQTISEFYSKEDGSIPIIDIQFLSGFVPVRLRQKYSNSGSTSSQRSRDRSPLMDTTDQGRPDRNNSSTSRATDRGVAMVNVLTNSGGELESTVDTTSSDHPLGNASRLDVVPPKKQVEPSITADVADGSVPLGAMLENESELDRLDSVFLSGPVHDQEDGQEESLGRRESGEFGGESERNIETRTAVDGLAETVEEPGANHDSTAADSATSTVEASAVARPSSTTVLTAASPPLQTNASSNAATSDDSELDISVTKQTVTVPVEPPGTRTSNERRNGRERSSVTPQLPARSQGEDVPEPSSAAMPEVSSSEFTSPSLPGPTSGVSVTTRFGQESDVGSLHSDSTDIRAAYKDSSASMYLLQETDSSCDIPVMPAHESIQPSESRTNRFVPTPASGPVEANAQTNSNNTPPVAEPGGQCSKRPFGKNSMSLTYPAGSVLPSGAVVGVEIEYHSLYGVSLSTLHLRMMKLTVKFIASCLNSRCKGTIGFGINGHRDTASTVPGHVVGILVEKNLMELIHASLTNILEHHIVTEKFSKLEKLQKESITLHPIRVTSVDSLLSKVGDVFVFEIDVNPQWDILGDHFFYYWWFSSFYNELLGANAYRVYKNEDLIGTDREKRILVERRDGETRTQQLTYGAFLREEVQKKHRHYREKMEKEQYEQPSALVSDESALVKLLTERLKAISTPTFNYVLFANHIPGDMRTARSPFPFNFLKLLPWVAVVDFDPNSETDGLYRCLTSHVDDGGAALSPLPLHHDDCEKYFTRSSHKMFGKARVLHAAHQLPWIFANGREGEFERVDDFGTWYIQCQSNIDFALRQIKDQFPSLVAVFLVFDKSSVQEMASLVDSVFRRFKLAQNITSEKRLVILCDDQSTAESLCKSCRVPYVRNHCIAGLPWNDVGQIVTDLTGTLPHTDGGKLLFASSGVTTRVPPKKLSEWKSIEVLDCYENRKVVEQNQIAAVRDNFYRGEPVSWDNLKLNHDVQRDIAIKVKQCVVELLKARSSRRLGGSPTKVTISTSVVTILHRPGTGGSTVARRILWDIQQEMKCRCAVLDGITEKTLQHLEDLQKFGEKTRHSADCLPLLLCWDGDDMNQFMNLVYQLSRRGVRGVIIEVKALSHPDFDEDEVLFDNTFLVCSELKDGEVSRFKALILRLEANGETKDRLLKYIDRDRRLIYFGLHLFGKRYNQERLKKYVLDRLQGVSYIEQQLLRFCSFVYIYGHMSIPRSCFTDRYLAGSADETEPERFDCLTPSCADLLLEIQETTDKFSYCGWRPAHQLVAEVILEDQDRVRTAIDFMTTMLRGRSYAKKYLAEVACELFSKRVYCQQGYEWYDEYDEIATDFCRDRGRSKRSEQSQGRPKRSEQSQGRPKRSEQSQGRFPKPPRSSRYSLFIKEILESPHYGRDTVLALWFTLCTYVRDNAYAWQHFARFLALDVGGNCVAPLLCHYICELLDRNIGVEEYGSLQLTPNDDVREGFLKCDDECCEELPKLDGFEVAIRCIGEAHCIEANVSAIYSTEGLIHKTRLEWFSTNLQKHGTQVSVEDVETALTITFSAIEAFKKAQDCRQRYRNWYPLVGEIQVCLKMLQIVKDTPFFEKRYTTRDESSFESYVSGEAVELPRKMSPLLPNHIEFLKCLVQRILHLLHSVFQHESALHADRSSEEPVQRCWQVAVVAASELQVQFYSTLALDTDTIHADRDRWEHNPKMRELLCDAMLKDRSENPYGSWQSLAPRFLQRIIQLLMPVVKQRGHKVGCSTVVALIRACLEIDTDRQPKWSDIIELVHNCCIDFPQSEWAFMFRGMIHFPMPNCQHGLIANPKLAIESFRTCETVMEKKPFLFKRARPRYFVGRNSNGEHVIISFNRISSWFGKLERHRTEGLYLKSPEWWRSHPAWTRLARLEGTRQERKIINYQGIKIRMDQDPNPRSEGRERLWFCVGFTVQGPVAFDPLDKDTYSEVCEKEERGEILDFDDIIEARRATSAGTDKTSDNTEENRRGISTGSSGTHSRDGPPARVTSRSRKPQQRTLGNIVPDTLSQTTVGHRPPGNVKSTSVPTNAHSGNVDSDVKTGDSKMEEQTAGLPVVEDTATSRSTSVTSPGVSATANNGRGPASVRSAVTSLTSHVKTPTVTPVPKVVTRQKLETKEGTLATCTRDDSSSSSSSIRPVEDAGVYSTVGKSKKDNPVGAEGGYQADPSSVKSPANSRPDKRAPVAGKTFTRRSCDLNIYGIKGLSDSKIGSVARAFGPSKLKRQKGDSAIITFESPRDAETALKALPTAFEGRVITVQRAKNSK